MGDRLLAALLVVALTGASAGASRVARAQRATPPASGEGRREEARAHLHQGRALFEQGNFEAAVVEFETAYALLPHRDILYNVAQCYERLFRYGLARDNYARFAAEAPPDDPYQPRAVERVAALDSVLGVLEIRTNVRRAEVWVDGHVEGTAPGTVRLSAGQHRVELRARGHLPEAIDVRLVGREHRSVEVRLERGTRVVRGGIHPAAFLTAAGLAVAAAGAGAVLGVRALDLSSEYEANPARTRTQQQDGQDVALAADVLFVGAGVLAVTAGVLLFVTDWGGGADGPEGSRSAQASVAPWLGVDQVGVVVGGALP